MGLSDTVFGTPGTTTTHQAPGTRDPGFGFAKKFFNSLGPVMNSPYPTYQGNIDPGMSPTVQDAIRRAQGYAQSGPSEILQGAQGSLGRFMSPNFQNPYNALFGGAANYGNADPNQRIYGGGTAGGMTFQTGMEPNQGGASGGGASSGGVPGGGDPNYAIRGRTPDAGGDMARLMTATAGPGGFPPGTTNIDPGNTSGPMGASASGMAPSVSAALEQLFQRPASAFDGGGMPGGSEMGVMPSAPTTSGPPSQPAWGSGGNAQRGFQDFMGTIDKQFRGGSPSEYLKAMMQKNPGMDPMMPQGGAGTDWRKYWKALGRPGAPGGGGQGGGNRHNRPTDLGVSKPIPKKKPPYEVLTATTGR